MEGWSLRVCKSLHSSRHAEVCALLHAVLYAALAVMPKLEGLTTLLGAVHP